MCIIYAEDSKSKTRNYKNFLIYLTNYYQLTNTIDETNLTFEKFSRKLEILIQESEEDTDRKTAKSARKNAKEIFEIVRLGRTPKISFNDTVSIIIGVAYRTGIFGDVNNIKIVHQVAYQKIIKDGNYLELSEEETVTQLLSYIKNIPYLKPSSKGKGRNTGNIIPLVLSIGIAGSVSPILPVYIQQITLSEFNTSSNSSFLGNWFRSNCQSSAF